MSYTPPFPLGVDQPRWRVMLVTRMFTLDTGGVNGWSLRVLSELTGARSRVLTQQWNQSAQFIFTMDGDDPATAMVSELATDVVVLRWNEYAGYGYVPVFRGIVAQSEDEISDSHVVNFTCHDYLAMLQRRFYTSPNLWNFTNVDQDSIAAQLLSYASAVPSGSGSTSFSPGSFLPLVAYNVNPDGTSRSVASGQVRVRAFTGQSNIGELLDDLAHVIQGFDYDTVPWASGMPNLQRDPVRIFYPSQGVSRSDVTLVFGSTDLGGVASLTRSVNSADYANYQRVLGNNGDSDTSTPQLFSEAWNSDANNVTVNPVGLWQAADNAADVNQQATLDQQAQGNLALSGLLVPSYSLNLAPNAYRWGFPNMGDTVGLVVQSGRLNVTSLPPAGGVRVVGITYTIGDDGQEDVDLTVGRPSTQLFNPLIQSSRDVNALARR
jgi:hypothetical protein